MGRKIKVSDLFVGGELLGATPRPGCGVGFGWVELLMLAGHVRELGQPQAVPAGRTGLHSALQVVMVVTTREIVGGRARRSLISDENERATLCPEVQQQQHLIWGASVA